LIVLIVVLLVSVVVALFAMIWRYRRDVKLMWYLAIFSGLILVGGYFLPEWAMLLFLVIAFLTFERGCYC